MPVTERRALAVALALITIARSAVFVFAPGSQFDADQAVTGLMAKHLSELRAFPVFWYGQTYMLGVEAWMAAPIMAIAGATVTALKLPLLVINVAIVLLLFGSLVDDAGLEPRRAAFATLFFAAATPITAAHYLTANGGNVEPCLYVLLLWRLRRRAIWFGFVLGLGFLNREFTVYGAIALLAIEGARGTLFSRDALRRYALALATAASVWIVVMVLRHFSSAAGPGTSMADLSTSLAANNLLQVTERLCLNPRAIVSGAGQIFSVHWPELFGLEAQPLTDFGIESRVTQGMTGAPWLLVPLFGIPLVSWLQRRLRRQGLSARAPASGSDVCGYLLVTATLSILGYLVGRCGLIDFHTMRYELLSPLGAAGLAGWFLRDQRTRLLAAAWTACGAAVFAVSLTAHGRLIAEYTTHPPVPLKVDLIQALEARGVRYAYADYWTAYYVTFMTRERIVVASDAVVKVRSHNRLVDAHRGEAIRIARSPCAGGTQLTPAFWACGT
jgi:hypothetical protein